MWLDHLELLDQYLIPMGKLPFQIWIIILDQLVQQELPVW